MLGFHPLEIAGQPFLGHEQRQRFQVFEPLRLDLRVHQKYLRVFLEDRGDADDGHLVGHRVERQQIVGRHREVEFAGHEQDAVVDVRPARHDRHVKAVAFIGAVSNRLEETAMLGLGHPVGAERHLVELVLRLRRGERPEQPYETGR